MSMIRSGKQDSSRLEFNLLYCLAFVIFFVAIAVSRLVPRRMRSGGRRHQGKSIFEAARTAAGDSIPFAFM